jgi:hypothetical protein
LSLPNLYSLQHFVRILEHQKFSKKLLLQKANGTKNYQIEFTVGKCVQPAPAEEKERTKKNEEKDDAAKKEKVNFRNKLNKAMEKNKKEKKKKYCSCVLYFCNHIIDKEFESIS